MPENFPLRDPVGPQADPLPRDVVETIAARVAAHAEEVDRTGVPRSTLDALARAGLLGDALAPSSAMRELSELLAGSDASTWFCWVQHQTPLRILRGDTPGLREPAHPDLLGDLLPRLRGGHALAAVAFAHVRRPGPANPVATKVHDGWRLDGRLDWVTSWDIADVVMIMAQGAPPHEDVLVCAYLPAGASVDRGAGLTPGAPLDLLAMSGTHTRPVTLDGVHVPNEAVGAILDRDAWLAHDARRTLDANPAAFGVARGALAHLESLAEQRANEQAIELARDLGTAVAQVRTAAYAAADADGDPAQRAALRARSLDLAAASAEAVITTLSGAAMLRGNPAERRLREAMFLLVQAQTPATRAASLALLSNGATALPDLA